MKRLLTLLTVVATLSLVAPAAAGPVPSIRATEQYQSLKAYVMKLQAERDDPVSAAKRSKFTAELTKKRARAIAEGRRHYQARLRNARERKAGQLQKIAVIKRNKQRELAALNASRTARLREAQSNENTAIARIREQAQARLAPLVRERAKLRRQVSKAKNPLRRQALRVELDSVQDEIIAISRARQNDIDSAVAKYNSQARGIRDTFADRIESAKEDAVRQIVGVRESARARYQQRKTVAMQIRKRDFGQIDTVRQRGMAYINQMKAAPPPTPPPAPTVTS